MTDIQRMLATEPTTSRSDHLVGVMNWSGLPLRFPNLRILIVEGGVGWLPMLAQRADYALDHPVSSGETSWDGGLRPSRPCRMRLPPSCQA